MPQPEWVAACLLSETELIMWNERYSKPGYAYGVKPNDFLEAEAHRLPKGSVLSLAEGEGRNAVYLASLGYRVTCVDSSSVGLAKAERLAIERGVVIETVVADLAEYDIGHEQWDGIIAIFCHLPSALRRQVNQRVVTGLKPGGIFLLEGYTPEQLELGTGGPADIDMLMAKDQLVQELDGLDFIISREVVRSVVEGDCHSGQAAVLQMIAVRK